MLRAALGAGLDRAAAEDVAQSARVTFLEVSGRFEGRSKVRTLLFEILYKLEDSPDEICPPTLQNCFRAELWGGQN